MVEDQERQREAKRLAARITARRLELKIESEADLLRLANLKGSTVLADLRRKASIPSLLTASKLATALKWSLNELRGGLATGPGKLKVTGITGSGEMWAEVTPSANREISLAILGEPLETIEIATNDIPGYRQGDFAAGPRMLGVNLDNLIGSECIVQTKDGRRLMCYLMRGQKPGLYTLRSHLPTVPDLIDVPINWAAPVKIIFRSPQ